ncbi:MAG: hypothetical protein ACFB0Z_12725 [Candidatus Phaeomarinobacter sp.]
MGMRLPGMAIAVLLAGIQGAVAETTTAPDFLKHKYAANPEACAKSDAVEKRGLVIADGSISGTEFGCAFLTYTPVVWDKDFPPQEYVVLASCGDDSGITRPDHLSIINYGDKLQVQSQNEYVEMVAKGAWNEPGFVSRTYPKCPAG